MDRLPARVNGPHGYQLRTCSAILREDRLLKVVFSDPSIASLQQAYGYQLSLADYAARRYVPESRPLPPEVSRTWGVFRGNNVAAVDATTALRISRLVPPPSSISNSGTILTGTKK